MSKFVCQLISMVILLILYCYSRGVNSLNFKSNFENCIYLDWTGLNSYSYQKKTFPLPAQTHRSTKIKLKLKQQHWDKCHFRNGSRGAAEEDLCESLRRFESVWVWFSVGLCEIVEKLWCRVVMWCRRSCVMEAGCKQAHEGDEGVRVGSGGIRVVVLTWQLLDTRLIICA